MLSKPPMQPEHIKEMILAWIEQDKHGKKITRQLRKKNNWSIRESKKAMTEHIYNMYLAKRVDIQTAIEELPNGERSVLVQIVPTEKGWDEFRRLRSAKPN